MNQADKDKLYKINREAALYFKKCLLSSQGKVARDYLASREIKEKDFEKSMIGYAPRECDGLLKHLRAKGYSRSQMVDAGLCVVDDKGHVYDRFRDMVMFPNCENGNIKSFSSLAFPENTIQEKNVSEKCKDVEKVQELKPCPFCGAASEDIEIVVMGSGMAYIRCSKCMSRCGMRDGVDEAEKFWNRNKT